MDDMAEPIVLHGSDFERGFQQAAACPDLVGRVKQAVEGRLSALGPYLTRTETSDYLHAQKDFLRAHDGPGFEESRGIAEGFGFAHDDLLAYLHGNVVADMAMTMRREQDGCTAWAQKREGRGALVVKNRDYRGEHGALQKVFRHVPPERSARTLLCVGSLGSPGAFSSGMNSDGLAVVDTQIGTTDHGVGWLRYFLMTALLRECRTTAEAVAFLSGIAHAGGGSLVLGDRLGAVAAVELSHSHAPSVTDAVAWVAHTNHFLTAALAMDELLPKDDLTDSTTARMAQIQDALKSAACELSVQQAKELMSSHADPASICRHADDDRSRTLSCVIYETQTTTLHIAVGNPCLGNWQKYPVVV